MTIQPDAVLDRSHFRQALGQFPTGVCVVTSTAAGELLGMTVSSFNALSLEPPLVLFSVDRRSASLPLWEQAEGYAINVLADNQRDISIRFAKSRANKWEGMSYATGLFGAPVLSGGAAVFECAAWARHDAGDHILVHRRGKALSRLLRQTASRFWQGPVCDHAVDGFCGAVVAARHSLLMSGGDNVEDGRAAHRGASRW